MLEPVRPTTARSTKSCCRKEKGKTMPNSSSGVLDVVDTPITRPKKTTIPTQSKGRRLGLSLPLTTFTDLENLAEQRRATMTEIIRLAVGLLKIAIHETQQGNKLVVAKENGEVLKELVLPG